MGELSPLTPSLLWALYPYDLRANLHLATRSISSNICLQLLEICLTVKKVSAHTSSTVYRRPVHTLTSFIFKTRVVHCKKKIFTKIWKYIIAFILSKARNVSWTSVTKFKTHVLCIYFHISSNEHSGATQYTYVLASYATSDSTRVKFPSIILSRFWRWRLSETKKIKQRRQGFDKVFFYWQRVGALTNNAVRYFDK